MESTTECAACGKKGNSDDMNTCNKCKMVKYCNAACKKKHRKKHKKACDRRVAELHEEALFKDSPPREECPICFLTLPIEGKKSVFKSCCGKTICNGCMYAMKMSEGKDLCAFCRTPPCKSDKEEIKRLKNLMDKGNGEAYNALGSLYRTGDHGLVQDDRKANELYLKAGGLGCAMAYYNLGMSYNKGKGVEMDKEKAKHYWELAIMGGDLMARHNLGCSEGLAGNHQRAMKHLRIAARAGDEGSLDNVKHGFMVGDVTKDEYTNTLRAYQKSNKEMKSDERDRAALALL